MIDKRRAARRGTPRWVCRSCWALPADELEGGAQRCPWCRGRLSLEFGPVVARCVECGVGGVVGIDLASRSYDKGTMRVSRAVCPRHVTASEPTVGYGPITRSTPQ